MREIMSLPPPRHNRIAFFVSDVDSHAREFLNNYTTIKLRSSGVNGTIGYYREAYIYIEGTFPAAIYYDFITER